MKKLQKPSLEFFEISKIETRIHVIGKEANGPKAKVTTVPDSTDDPDCPSNGALCMIQNESSLLCGG